MKHRGHVQTFHAGAMKYTWNLRRITKEKSQKYKKQSEQFPSLRLQKVATAKLEWVLQQSEYLPLSPQLLWNDSMNTSSEKKKRKKSSTFICMSKDKHKFKILFTSGIVIGRKNSLLTTYYGTIALPQPSI